MRNTAQTGREQSQSGFSIIELVVGVTIFIIVMGAIYGLLELGRSGRLNTTQRSEVLQNMRIAINTLGRDAINAGVDYPNQGAMVPDDKLRSLANIANIAGQSLDVDNEEDMVTPVYAKNDVNRIGTLDTDQVTIAFIDDTFNGNSQLPISSIDADGQKMSVGAGGDPDNCSVGDIYVITGQNGSAIGWLTGKEDDDLKFEQGDPLGINGDDDPATNPIAKVQAPASIQRINWVTYYVADEDGNGTGTGTIRRRVYGGSNAGAAGFVDQPLAFGIENFQVQYVLADGTVVDVPAIDAMIAIRQVRVSVSVRSPDLDPKTNQPFRSSLTATFNTRNLAYEKL